MSKKEQLDKEFAKLMNWRDKVFQLFLAMLTAEAIMIYAIISGEKPLYWIYNTYICRFAYSNN